MKKDAGFTLIEILVVIVIISIVITSALLSMQHFMQDRSVITTAKALKEIIPVAQQQAILQPAILGLKINKNNYEFYRFNIDAQNNTGTWQLIKRDRVLAKQNLAKNIRIDLTTHEQNFLTDNTNSVAPQIIFFPSGDMTAFKIEIAKKGQVAAYSLVGQENGNIVLNNLTK